MKRRLILLLLLLLATLWIMRNLKHFADKKLVKENPPIHTLQDSLKKQFQNGDIILRYGYGYVSEQIVDYLNEEQAVSHCGIIYKKDNHWQVIHSDSADNTSKDGVQITDFDVFTNHSKLNSIIVVRLKDIDSLASQKVINLAKNYADNKIPFDYTFDQTDDSKLFCTELIYQSFLQATGKNIFLNTKGKTDLLQFKNLYNSNHFRIIFKE